MKIEDVILGLLFRITSIVPMDALKVLFIVASIVPTVVLAGTSGPAPIPPPPSFQVSTSTLTLCRGIVNNVPVVISNPGSQAMTSLQLGLVASRNIYAIGNGTVNQETVSGNSMATVYMPIFVSLNTSSLASVGVSVSYNYLTLYSDSEVRNMSFGIETCTSPLSVQTSPIVTSGRIENLTLNLTNTGTKALNAIAVSIGMPSQDAAILTSQPTQVGTLAAGAKAQISERVFIYRNASQSFPLNVTVNMYNGTSPVQQLDTIPLLSTGIINITSSSITLSPTTPTAGSIFSVSLILTDIGTAGASAVTVTPLPPSGITSYGSPSVFVGDMSVDTQVPVTMTLAANSSLSSGIYSIPVRISYINNLRENESTMISVPVTFAAALGSNLTRGAAGGSRGVYVTTGGRSGGFLTLIIIIIILIILAAVLYVKRKWVMKRVNSLMHKTK